MSVTRLAGILVFAAAALLAFTLVISLGGGSVSVRGDGPGSLTFTFALLLLGAGLAILAMIGPRPVDGRIVRTGFGLIVVGGSVELATANVPPESLLILAFLLGGLAVLVGVVVTGIGLLRAAGRPRWVGLGFVAGMLLVIAAGLVGNDPSVALAPDAAGLRAVTSALAVAAAGLMLISLAGLGFLAIASTEPAGPVQSAE